MPDPDYRHVHSAALKCGADSIATFNIKDFPRNVVEEYGILVGTPDEIFLEMTATDMEGFLAAVATVRARLKAPTVPGEA